MDEAGNTAEVEPLAANLRGADWKKKLKDEKLRLLAPMLSVTYDELKQRERQRTLKKAAVVSAAALVAAAGLAVFLSVNHARAERLRQEAEQQAQIAEAERARAEEERARAEEEQRKKEQERKNAVFNDLGERLERASAALQNGEKRTAASILLEALSVSDENEGMRREELMTQLRKALYIEPLTVVSSFNNQNVRVNDITVSADGTRAIGIVNSNAVAMIDLNADEILYQVSVGNTMINALSFSPDGTRFLANCDLGRVVTVWNSADGSVAFTYTSKADQPYHIANALFWKDASQILVQDMERFYLVSEDGTEELFYTMGDQMPDYSPENNLLSRLSGRSLEEMFTFHTDDYTGTQVLATADRSRIVVAGARGDTAVIVLDDTGRRISLLGVPRDPACFMPGVFSEKWSLTPDGRTVACLSLLGIIGGWDTDSGELLRLNAFDYSEGFDFSRIAFSADSQRMAYTAENHLYVDLARGADGHILDATIDETSFVPYLAFTEDGAYLILTNQSLFIINAQNWALELLENADFGSNYNNVIPLSDSFLITRYDGTANFYSMSSLSSVQTVDSFQGELSDPIPASFPCVPLQSEHRYILCGRGDRALRHRGRRLRRRHDRRAVQPDRGDCHERKAAGRFGPGRQAPDLRFGEQIGPADPERGHGLFPLRLRPLGKAYAGPLRRADPDRRLLPGDLREAVLPPCQRRHLCRHGLLQGRRLCGGQDRRGPVCGGGSVDGRGSPREAGPAAHRRR